MTTTTIVDVNYKLNFGKYKGKTIEYVLTFDPSYLFWAHNNIEWFKLSKELYDGVTEYTFQEKMWYELETMDRGIDIYDFMD